MTRPRRRFKLLLPTPEKIALAYGVDQTRALQIQASFRTMFKSFGNLIEAQAELIEGQVETARLIDKQTRQAQDTGKIRRDTLHFLSGNPVQVERVLDMVFSDFWKAEFMKLPSDIKTALFAELSVAINSLEEPEG